MAANRSETAERTDREIVIQRVFEAPRELVFEAWTDADQVAKWWGPNGFTTTTYEMDVRPGGTWRFTMHGPDGVDYENKIEYIEVVPPERLVYMHGGADDDGTNPFHVTVTFDDQGDKTEITMRSLFESAEERDKTVEFGAIEGAHQTLGRLAEHLKSAA